jgi:glutamyl-tRNA synthetase
LFAAGARQRLLGYRGRFAPSPTGCLHRGNLRTALLAWLAARLAGGEFLLRLDDLDTPRNRAGAEASICRDLRWLGLNWDGPIRRQSEHRGTYATVLAWLRRSGCLYPCRCSRRLLADISAPHGATPVYPGTCSNRALGWGADAGRLPSWRLRLPPGLIRWQERFAADGCVDGPALVGDVVLRRADGFLAYHLATVVDELSLGITEVVRGADLRSATAAQVALMGMLAAEPPRYAHVPLCRDGEGRRLSKRDGSAGLAELRAGGWDAPQVIGDLAAGVGLVPAGSRLSSSELLQQLTAEHLERTLTAAEA